MAPNLITLCTEVQLKIYSFACMDDGRTGCTLSAVSKLVRDLSAEYRYQSVAVAGSVSLSAFLRELRSLPPQLRRVRHLFISDHSQSYRPSPQVRPHRVSRLIENPFQLPDLDLEPMFSRILSGFESKRTVEHVPRIIADIMEIVSATLLSLTLVSFTPRVNEDAQTPTSLLDYTFTSLVELTVRGPHIIPTSNTFAPSLQRLHLSSDALPQEFGRTAALNHPSLTHVRVSRLLDIQRHFKNILELALAMGIRARLPTDVDIATMQNKRMRVLLVERGVYLTRSRGRYGGHLEERYPPAYDALGKVFQVLKRHSRGFILLPDHPGHGQVRERQYAHEQWLSRLEGRQGCWQL